METQVCNAALLFVALVDFVTKGIVGDETVDRGWYGKVHQHVCSS